MRKNKYTFLLIATVMVIVILIYVAKQYLGDTISDIVTISTAIFGAMAIWYQLRKDYQITKAGFIYNLNDTFANNENIAYIYSRLKEYRDLPSVVLTEEDGRKMGDYVMYFEIMGYLLAEDMITMDMMNRIFANKFFIFVNNPYVQAYQMKYSQINKPILELYCQWYNYRLKKREPELYPVHSLKTYEDYFLTDEKGYLQLNPAKANVGYQVKASV
jgi:hypothetical protein